jgi:hypothetical protein
MAHGTALHLRVSIGILHVVKSRDGLAISASSQLIATLYQYQ